MEERALVAATPTRGAGLPGLLLGVTPFGAGHEALVIDLAPIIEADIERVLMTGLGQLVVKANARLDATVRDR